MGIDPSALLSDKVLSKVSPSERKRLKLGPTAAEASAATAHRSEKEMQETIKQWLDLKGWYYVWQRMDKRATGKLGQPDFVICVPFTRGTSDHGLFVAIECKMPSGNLSMDQHCAAGQIIKACGEYILARSAKQAIDWLIELSK